MILSTRVSTWKYCPSLYYYYHVFQSVRGHFIVMEKSLGVLIKVLKLDWARRKL